MKTKNTESKYIKFSHIKSTHCITKVKPTFFKFILTISSLTTLFIAILLIGLWSSFPVFSIFPLEKTIVIESRESKNNNDIPVLNRITFRRNLAENQDLWLMEQSHDDNAVAENSNFFEQASFVSIAVDLEINKNSDAQTVAHFREHNPSGSTPLPANHPNNAYPWPPEKKYSVACALCHSNGPRLIRPNWNSSRAPLSLTEKVFITLWNFRIKTYGPIKNIGQEGLHLPGEKWKKLLTVQSCIGCHKIENRNWIPWFLTRKPLTRENFLSIRFLLNEGSMPPRLHKVTESDYTEILNFLK